MKAQRIIMLYYNRASKSKKIVKEINGQLDLFFC